MSPKIHPIRFLLVIGFASVASISCAQPPIDVQREIWPLLRAHCLHCHGSDRAEGALRLDQKSWIEKGGHTGSVVLGSVEESELLRRLQSDDPHYRMPKRANPLSDHTIQVFRRWIEQGAPWPEDRALQADIVLEADSLGSRLSRNYDRALEIREALKSMALPTLVVLGLLFVLQRRKRRLGDRNSDQLGVLDRIASKIRLTHYVTVLLLMALIVLAVFHRAEVSRLESQKQEYVAILEQFDITEFQEAKSHTSRYPQPDHPRHPPRLGGTYYRGNDERDPSLFNGGYYRTATMHLSLRDAENNKLEWLDNVESGQLLVCLEIVRATLATRELFRDERMEHCRLTSDLGGKETPDFTDQAVKFQILESGERWRACFPIGEPTLQGKEQWSGMLYVCNAFEFTYGHSQYGISYDVHLDDGTISNKSQLWMGATSYAGNYIRPPQNFIVPNEWFTFLPIPEIEGSNTSDPMLLGIPEHNRDAK